LEAKEVRLETLFSNARESYKVPKYQRTYAWTKDQWSDLYYDITSLSEDEVHFLGSIVVIPDEGHRIGINFFRLVDGQQRLATLLIWLAAIRDKMKRSGKPELASHINETFIFSKDWSESKEIRVPKVKLGELDDEAFLCILNNTDKRPNHLIFECYEYFYKKQVPDDFWQKILKNISIVHVNVFNYFNAFRLFETLNDRGLELSAIDLVKNFFLMKVANVAHIFNKVMLEWNEMYDKVRDKEPVKFLRRYMLATYSGKIAVSKLYDEIQKRVAGQTPQDILQFAKNLNSRASIYQSIYEKTFDSIPINTKLELLHLIEVSPSYTLLINTFPYFLEDKLSEDEILKILEMIEIFHIRWGICKQATSKLDSIYNKICIELSNLEPTEFVNHIHDVLSNEIKNNTEDNLFKRNFEKLPLKPGERRSKYILWKLSQPTGETIMNINEIQTEHIMPKNLNRQWKQYITNISKSSQSEVEALHKENRDRLGNLTIIKGDWNRNMSQKLFSHKKADYYNQSEFKVTQELVSSTNWTFYEINQRSTKLAEKALEVWKWS